MNPLQFSWPGGKSGALTTSWDDGTIHDRRLVKIHNTYGLRGTWNLNSGKLDLTAKQCGWHGYIRASEVASLFKGHEVACHSVTHPSLDRIPEESVFAEMVEDRRALEGLVGYPVKGMSLPNGAYDSRVLRIIRECGIVYCRPVRHVPDFRIPPDFMDWHSTCHHKADLCELWGKFKASGASDKLFYLWGHSYEFDNDRNWGHFEAFAELAARTKGVWFATNMEIYEYVKAWRNLQCAVDLSSVRNTSCLKLSFRCQGKLFTLKPGETRRLAG